MVLVAVGLTVQGAALAQADPQVAAIQAVIQQANGEQAQALSTSNPSLMTDTATSGGPGRRPGGSNPAPAGQGG